MRRHYLIACDYSLRYVGGAQSALMRQVDALIGAGHRVSVLAPDARDAALNPQAAIVPVPRSLVIPGMRLPLLANTSRLRRRMRTMLASRDIDAVIVHSELGLTAALMGAARQVRIPVLHTVHTFYWQAGRGAQLFAPVVRIVCSLAMGRALPRLPLAKRPLDSALRSMTLAAARAADVVLSPSQHQAARLREFGAGEVVALSNATDIAAGRVPLPPFGPLTLAWIGRFAPEKRLDVARDAVARARASGAAIELVIAGGQGRAEHPGERFVGRLARAAVPALFDECHALLLTSAGFDNQPMVVLEAAARGRPVIVVDPALAQEFGAASIFLPGETAAELAAGLVTLASDPGRLSAAAQSAAASAEGYSGQSHAAALDALVDQLQRASAAEQ